MRVVCYVECWMEDMMTMMWIRRYSLNQFFIVKCSFE